MNFPKQSFSVCLFNEKYIFAFGGKVLTENATITNQAFEFAKGVEVFDTERGIWKSINYIQESQKLMLVNPGVYQITGKKIIIFGGIKPVGDEIPAGSFAATDNGQQVCISNETLFFNVSNGEIKRGPDLNKASYYMSGGFVFPQAGSIHAFGFTTLKEANLGIYGLSGEGASA